MPRPFTYSMVLSEHRGTWSSTMNYFAGDMCDYTSNIWICLKKHTNVTPVEGIYWHLFNTYPLAPVLTGLTVNGISNFVQNTNIACYFEDSNSVTTGIMPVIRCRAATTADMIDNYGPSIEFSIKDSANIDNQIGNISCRRNGNDNSGYMSIATLNTGVGASRIIISAAGLIGISAYPELSDGVGIDINGKLLRIRTSKTPASATATGKTGEICWDSSYIYICIATNTWRRIAHDTW